MLTPDGQAAVAGWIGQWLADAELFVSDGTTEARTPAVEVLTEGVVVTLRAVFAENDANFEWRRRGVVAGGMVVDVEEGDFGRKPVGAIWTLEVPIELEAS